jgi:pyruvate dehydrogenase E1 component alpha subunit
LWATTIETIMKPPVGFEQGAHIFSSTHPMSLPTSGASPAPIDLYAQMVRVRALNDEAINLHRQGALYGFAPLDGQEAAQVGSAAALDPRTDFAFPTYREFGAAVVLGVDPVALLAHHRGYADGGAFDSAAAHVAPLNAVVGGTALHAVGWAMGAKLDDDRACALAYFGDGASSQGEIHEAMNFAAVFHLPVVCFCQNNGWAISVPAREQIGGGSVAARAAGYGLPGVQVDGNDVLAVHATVSEAVARARAGDGATVIEAMTYRLGPHATSDDPSRYRSAHEEDLHREREPLTRTRRQLLRDGLIDDDAMRAIDRMVAEEIDQVRERLAQLRPPAVREQFELVYARVPDVVADQIDSWCRTGELDG